MVRGVWSLGDTFIDGVSEENRTVVSRESADDTVIFGSARGAIGKSSLVERGASLRSEVTIERGDFPLPKIVFNLLKNSLHLDTP